MTELQDVRVMTEGLAFPEGPIALGDGSVMVVEIRRGVLTRIWPDGRTTQVAEVGGGPNGAARGPDGAIYVCNNSGFTGYTLGPPGIQRVDLNTGSVDVLYAAGDGVPLGRPNDIVFDEVGNFWFTDIEVGTVHYAAPDGSSIRLAWDGLNSPNGIGLSPDGRTLYSAQTRSRQLLRRDVVAPGELEPSANYDTRAYVRTGKMNPDVLVIGLPGAQELDSLAIDANGAVCVATLLESGITVISPQGEVIEKYTLPAEVADPVVTNICFGGDEMRTAYLTLSSTGRVISCRWPVPGLRLNFQDG